MINYIVKKIIKTLNPRYGLRGSDIILASYPKSGNTWVRFIWANIISIEERGKESVDFHALDDRLGSEFDTNSYGTVEFECLPRLVKTHEEYTRRSFGQQRCVYLYRHPGDVMVSYHAYLSARRDSSFRETSLSEFIRDPDVGLQTWGEHFRSWVDQADVLITYEGLKADAFTEIQQVLEGLEIDPIKPEVLRSAIERSSFERVRQVEKDSGRHDEHRFDPEYSFARSGEVGQWRKNMNRDDVEYVEKFIQSRGLQSLIREKR